MAYTQRVGVDLAHEQLRNPAGRVGEPLGEPGEEGSEETAGEAGLAGGSRVCGREVF
jgi:hypothetical protein